MVAAMTGDYSIYKSWSPTRSTTSGILVQDRRDLPPRHGKPGGRIQAQRPVHHGPPDPPPDEARLSGRYVRDGRGVQPQSRRPRDVDPQRPGRRLHACRRRGDDPGERRRRRARLGRPRDAASRPPGQLQEREGPEQVRDRRGVPPDRVDRPAAARLDAARNPLDLRDERLPAGRAGDRPGGRRADPRADGHGDRTSRPTASRRSPGPGRPRSTRRSTTRGGATSPTSPAGSRCS